MSRVRLTRVATPSTPATDKVELYIDTADRRLKSIDDLGVVSTMTPSGLERNFLSNGGFDINQRLAAALTNVPGPSATARVYTADRWGLTVGNVATPQFQQVDTIAAPEAGITARYYARHKQLTNTAKHIYSQVVPATDMAPLRGRVVRLQVKARYSVGSNRTMRLGLLQLNSVGVADTMPATFISAFNGAGVDPTLGTNLAYIAPTLVDGGSLSGSAMNFTLLSTWARYSATFVVPTNCVNLVAAVWSNDVLAANDDVLLTECGLYDGPEILDWICFPRNVELLRCQRFFCKTFAQGTAPAQSVGLNTGEHKTKKVVAGATAGRFEEWQFPVTMFKAPAVTLYNPAAANTQARDETNTVDASATATAGITDRQVGVTFTGNAATVAEGLIGLHMSADAEI